jgi:transglycosylase-like protein with SLT domain
MAGYNDPQFIQFINSIIVQESGGDYSAQSPDGALGAYQIMPNNIGPWSLKYLGHQVDVQTFISSPAIQDKIAMGRLLDYVNQYGYAGAAAAWYSGDPNMANNTNPQAGGNPSVAEYVQQVMARMAGMGTTLMTDNSGVSLANSNVPAVPGVQPYLSLAALQQQDPLVAALVTNVPELQAIFQKAVANGWNTDRFISAVQNSNWWATHSDTARQAFATMYSDPATWQKNITNLQATLTNLAAQLGANIGPHDLQNLAVDAIMNGYADNQQMIAQKFLRYITPVSGLHYGGEAGSTEVALRQAMNQMGVWLPEKTLDNNVQQITAGLSDQNSVIAQLRTQAAAKYPAYSQLINTGTSVSDIADPYIQQAQNLLEEGPGQVNIQSPMIQKALQFTQDGKPAPLPLNTWESQVRQDPRWQQTDNARDTVMTTAHKILQDFGLEF